MKANLPETIYFRSNTHTFNSHYYAAVLDGHIYMKPNRERTGADGPWEKIDLPKDLDGDVTEIALDGRQMIALNGKRRVFRMDDARGPVCEFFWSDRWGFPFAQGFGWTVKKDIIAWNLSVVSTPEDIMYTDPAGNRHGQPPKNEISCAHIIILNEGGRHLTSNDPWLPADCSYEIGMPYRGKFIAANMSSSGSTHFIINRYGDMFTRLYDFDISGYHNIFHPIPYSYEDQRLKKDPKWQLPAEEWKLQPKIKTSTGKACITDRITIIKYGHYCVDRMLRVEGLNGDGDTGFYEKDIKDPAWSFRITGEKPAGSVLENKPYDSSGETLGEGDEYSYSGDAGDSYSIRVPDFHPYCTPADFHVTLRDGNEIRLPLHSVGTVRLFKRNPGIDGNPRKYNGAIEVPKKILDSFDSLPAGVQQWIKGNLDISGDRRFTKVKMKATTGWLRIKKGSRSWTLKNETKH